MLITSDSLQFYHILGQPDLMYYCGTNSLIKCSNEKCQWKLFKSNDVESWFFLLILLKKMSNILLKNNNPFSHNVVFATPYKCNNYSEHNEISYLY